MDIESIRKQYPITEDRIFLNHASTGPISHRTAEAMLRTVNHMHEPMEKNLTEWITHLERSRRLFADIIGASADEITHVQNTSSGLGLVANAIRWRSGDTVIVPQDEFPSNLYVWKNLRSLGVETITLKIDSGMPLLETLKKSSLGNVRLISLSAVDYLTGRFYELEEIGRFCRENGILFCVDGVQAVGAVQLDVKNCFIDFLACGGQKWLLAPPGTGFLFIRKELIEDLHVPCAGWMSVENPGFFEEREPKFAYGACRFEAGMPDFVALAGIRASLDELDEIGMENIYSRVRSLKEIELEHLESLGIKPSSQRSGILSFCLPGKIDEVRQRLEENRINVSIRGNYIRISPHFYNTEDEIEMFFNVVGSVTRSGAVRINVRSNIRPKVLITGATGTLGNAFCEEFNSRGHELYLVGRNESTLRKLAHKYSSAWSVVDLSKKESIESFIQGVNEKFDYLVNNAAVGIVDPFTEISEEKLREIFQVNFFTPARFIQVFLAKWVRGPGGILNVVSSGGRAGLPLYSAYYSSKAAFWTLSESLGRELKHRKITVTTIVPPHIESALGRKLGRRTLRYYTGQDSNSFESPAQIARTAVEALLDGKLLYIHPSREERVRFNAISPELFTNEIEKSWKP